MGLPHPPWDMGLPSSPPPVFCQTEQTDVQVIVCSGTCPRDLSTHDSSTPDRQILPFTLTPDFSCSTCPSCSQEDSFPPSPYPTHPQTIPHLPAIPSSDSPFYFPYLPHPTPVTPFPHHRLVLPCSTQFWWAEQWNRDRQDRNRQTF